MPLFSAFFLCKDACVWIEIEVFTLSTHTIQSFSTSKTHLCVLTNRINCNSWEPNAWHKCCHRKDRNRPSKQTIWQRHLTTGTDTSPSQSSHITSHCARIVIFTRINDSFCPLAVQTSCPSEGSSSRNLPIDWDGQPFVTRKRSIHTIPASQRTRN